MFFGSNTCKWLEPVGIVSSALFNCPVLHSVSNNSGNRSVQFFSAFYSFHQLFISFLRQPSLHHSFVKNVFSKNWCYFVHSFLLAGGGRLPLARTALLATPSSGDTPQRPELIYKKTRHSYYIHECRVFADLSFSRHANGSRKV